QLLLEVEVEENTKLELKLCQQQCLQLFSLENIKMARAKRQNIELMGKKNEMEKDGKQVLPVLLHRRTPYLQTKGSSKSESTAKEDHIFTIVSPIPRLRIPAKGASGRSLKPEDSQMGIAHPSNSEKWLKRLQKGRNNPSNHIPDNKKIRITMICESIHELVDYMT
ncbi:periplasmic solute-binding protein, partial [Striga asiatica]